MRILDFFQKRPGVKDVEDLAREILRIVEAARRTNTTDRAKHAAEHYARIYTSGTADARRQLKEFTSSWLGDIMLKLREPQRREVSPGVQMDVHHACALEQMALFSFLFLARHLGDFPEIEVLYRRELDAATKPEKRPRSNVIVVDFAKVLDEVKREKGGNDN